MLSYSGVAATSRIHAALDTRRNPTRTRTVRYRRVEEHLVEAIEQAAADHRTGNHQRGHRRQKPEVLAVREAHPAECRELRQVPCRLTCRRGSHDAPARQPEMQKERCDERPDRPDQAAQVPSAAGMASATRAPASASAAAGTASTSRRRSTPRGAPARGCAYRWRAVGSHHAAERRPSARRTTASPPAARSRRPCRPSPTTRLTQTPRRRAARRSQGPCAGMIEPCRRARCIIGAGSNHGD